MPPSWFLSDLEDRKKRRDKDSTDRTASSSIPTTTQPKNTTTTTTTQTDDESRGHKKHDSGITCVGDGKSRDCDLTRTFSGFLDGENMPDTDEGEDVGKGQKAWMVVKKMFGKK